MEWLLGSKSSPYATNTFAERFPSDGAFEGGPNWDWYNNQVYQYQQQQQMGDTYPVDTFDDRFNVVYGEPALPFGSDASYLRSEMMLGHGELDYYW